MIFDPRWLYFFPQVIVFFGVLGMLISDFTNHGEKQRVTLTIGRLALLIALIQAPLRGVYGLESAEVFGISFDPLTVWVECLIYLGALFHTFNVQKSLEVFLGARLDHVALTLLQSTVLSLLAGARAPALAMVLLFINLLIAALSVRIEITREEDTTQPALWIHTAFLVLCGMFMVVLMGGGDQGGSKDQPFIFIKSLNSYQNHVSIAILFLVFSFYSGLAPLGAWTRRLLRGLSLPSFIWYLGVTPVAVLVFFFRFFTKGQVLQASTDSLIYSPSIVLSGGELLYALICVAAILSACLAFSARSLRMLLMGILGVEWAHALAGVVAMNPITMAAILFKLATLVLLWSAAGISLSALRNGVGSDLLIDWRGVAYRAKKDAVVLSITLLSAIAIPPFFGFVGNFIIWTTLVRSQQSGFASALFIANLIASFAGATFVRSLWTRVDVDKRAKFEKFDPSLHASSRYTAMGAWALVFLLVLRADDWLGLVAEIATRAFGN